MTLPLTNPHPERLLQFFEYSHLPARLQGASLPFHDLAHHMVESVAPSPERTIALRKVLEAKDEFVRASL